MVRWSWLLGAVLLTACANEQGVTPCGITVCTAGFQCCTGCASNHFCSTECPAVLDCPDAGDRAPAPIDGGGGVDGGEVLDPGPGDDAGAGPPNAGEDRMDVLCLVDELCNGVDDDCDASIDEGGDCPGEVVQGLSGNAYLFDDAERTWREARSRCDSLGYTLAVIDDATEDAFVFAHLARLGFDDAWIGLDDRDDEMTWVWVDGSPIGYENWGEGEPNDGGSGSDCAVIMTPPASRASRWADRECDSRRPYICEAPTR